jgi:hypothetical protein
MTSSGDASHGSSGDAQITASCSSNDGIIGHGDWDAIRNKIYDILESYPGTKDDMTSISLLRPVSSPCDADNPIIVYVSVDYESEEEKWVPVVKEMQQYLQQYKHADLRVHLEHGTVDLF